MIFLEYPKCTTCKKEKKWLEENNIQFDDRNITQNNPSFDELKLLYQKSKLPIKKFINTSGMKYRELSLKDKLPQMNDDEIISLLFQPSFSTAKQVTDVSGRGVGLDVVKSKIESLSGEVDVKTKLGEGSTFSIRLPLTLAIIQALMVVVGNEKYAIALGSIQTIEDISPTDIKTVQGREVINMRGNVIPLIRLDEVVGVESNRQPDANMVVLIAKKGDKLAGLVVDELIGQQEIVIKSMGKYINKCKFISGATILGDGEIALIIDANALI